MPKNNLSIAKSLKAAGFYEPSKKKSERLDIVKKVTTKPQRVKIVDEVFEGKKFKDGGPSLAVGRGEKLSVAKGAGLTQKGRDKYNRETGSNLKAPQPKGGARKDSFCARMSGVVEHAKGDAPRAKASLKRWDCPGW
jgi:hypothetical protein